MATRSATSLKVVSSPTTSYSPRCRSTCRLHALSFPLLQDKRIRFIKYISLNYPVLLCVLCVRDLALDPCKSAKIRGQVLYQVKITPCQPSPKATTPATSRCKKT